MGPSEKERTVYITYLISNHNKQNIPFLLHFQEMIICRIMDNLLIKFGNRVRELRKAKGLSQEKLASES